MGGLKRLEQTSYTLKKAKRLCFLALLARIDLQPIGLLVSSRERTSRNWKLVTGVCCERSKITATCYFLVFTVGMMDSGPITMGIGCF